MQPPNYCSRQTGWRRERVPYGLNGPKMDVGKASKIIKIITNHLFYKGFEREAGRKRNCPANHVMGGGKQIAVGRNGHQRSSPRK